MCCVAPSIETNVKLIKTIIDAVDAYFNSQELGVRDHYLAQAKNLTELEARARLLERRVLNGTKVWR
jgi:hypothetical protein